MSWESLKPPTIRTCLSEEQWPRTQMDVISAPSVLRPDPMSRTCMCQAGWFLHPTWPAPLQTVCLGSGKLGDEAEGGGLVVLASHMWTEDHIRERGPALPYTFQNIPGSWAYWCTPVSTALGRQTQTAHLELKASPICRVSGGQPRPHCSLETTRGPQAQKEGGRATFLERWGARRSAVCSRAGSACSTPGEPERRSP